jgi:hypothetical protein
MTTDARHNGPGKDTSPPKDDDTLDFIITGRVDWAEGGVYLLV